MAALKDGPGAVIDGFAEVAGRAVHNHGGSTATPRRGYKARDHLGWSR